MKKLFLMMLAALFLSSSKAHEINALNTIIRADKKELVHAGSFPDREIPDLTNAFFNNMLKIQTVEYEYNNEFITLYSGQQNNIVTKSINNTRYLIDDRPGFVPVQVRDLEGYRTVNNAVDVTNGSNGWSFPDSATRANLDVFWALQRFRDRLFDVHGINGYDKDNVNPAKPYSC